MWQSNDRQLSTTSGGRVSVIREGVGVRSNVIQRHPGSVETEGHGEGGVSVQKVNITVFLLIESYIIL